MKKLPYVSADDWNAKHNIGDEFDYSPVPGIDDCELVRVHTRSAAWHIGHHVVAVLVWGRSGGVSVRNLFPVAS